MYENFREVIVASRNTTPSTMLITSPIKVRFRVISSRRCSEHIAGSRIFLEAAYDVFTWPLKKIRANAVAMLNPVTNRSRKNSTSERVVSCVL